MISLTPEILPATEPKKFDNGRNEWTIAIFCFFITLQSFKNPKKTILNFSWIQTCLQ